VHIRPIVSDNPRVGPRPRPDGRGPVAAYARAMASTDVHPARDDAAPTASQTAPARRGRGRAAWLAAGALVAAAGGMLWSQQRVPAPRPASAAPTAFSAERAIRHVQVLATETRFAGSPNHRRTRRYLQAQLAGLGLRPEIQRAAVVNRFSEAAGPEAGTVTNIVARIPGRASTGAIALNAHYDSGPGGPGASDCGSCVATVLETARALRAGPPLRNDVLLVFTDAEENGDLGAAAFAGQSALVRDIDVVLNWETTGSHGPSWLLGSNSSWLVKRVLDGTPQARTYSVIPSLIRGLLGPQQLNTDTQEYMDQGVAGVQFAYMRGTTDYHTVLDNTPRLGRGSLQMDGDYAVGLVRTIGGERLARRTGDRSTYFNVTGGVIVQYGPALAVALALLALVLFGACLVTGLRRGRLTVGGLLLGTVVFPVVTLATTAVAVAAWVVLKRSVPDLRVFSLGSDQNLLFVFGLVALAIAVFTALYQPLLRRARLENIALGAVAWWLVLTVAFALASPSASYLFTWPTLAALGVALWRTSATREPAWRWAAGLGVPLAALIVVYAPVALILTLLAIRLDAMGLPALGLVGLFAALATGLVLPCLQPPLPGGRWAVPAGAALLAVALLAVGVARLGYDERDPRPDFISYVYDAGTGRAAWEAGDRDSWTRPLLRDAERAQIELAPFATFTGWRAPAPRIVLPAPELRRIAGTTSGDTTTLRLRLRSGRGADNLAVRLRAPGVIAAATVEGRRIPVTAAMRDGELELPYVGLPREGITLVLALRGHGALRATMRDSTQGLPTGLRRPTRPAGTMPAALSFRADPTVVVGRAVLRF
jgi:hypothetical protein